MALEDISGYSLRRGLGSGSAGAVWLVRDLGSGRHAVLKRLPAAAVPDPSAFRRDLALAQGISHAHVARLLEVRRTEREWLLFSQYVAAGTLTGLLQRRGPLALGELVTLVAPLAQALGALHRAGLTHGHLDAGDVMFDVEGRPMLTDAGLRLIAVARDPTEVPPGSAPGSADRAEAPPGVADGPADSARTPPATANRPPGPADPPLGPVDVLTGPAVGAEAVRVSPRPQQDLAALTALALAAGGDPDVFCPALFSGDADEVGQRVLELAEPRPIHLGFGDQPASDARAAVAPSSASATTARSAPGPSSGVSVDLSAAGRPSGGPATRDASLSITNPPTRRSPGSAPRSTRRPRQRREQRNRRRQGHQRHWWPLDHRGILRSARPRRGILAAAGLAAVVVLVAGLTALEALDSTGRGPATAGGSAHGGGPDSAATDSDGGVDTAPPKSPSPGSPSPAPKTLASPAPTYRTSHPEHPSTSKAPSRTALQDGSPTPEAAADPGTATHWLRTLRTLDHQRSRVFATTEQVGLDTIYVRGSPPWRSDRSLLATYRQRRLRVEGLRLHISSVEVQRPAVGASDPSSVMLRVVDRLVAGAVVDRAGRRTPLPPGRAASRLVTLRKGPAGWRISGITAG